MNALKHKSQIQISQKPLKFSKNAFTRSFVEFYLVYYRFCLKRLRWKWQKLLTNSHFWTILTRIGCIFPFLIHLKKCLPAKYTSKKFFWISWSHWNRLNQKLIWNSKKNRDPKIAIFEEIRKIFFFFGGGRGICEKCYMLKIRRRCKINKKLSQVGPIIFAYLFN